MKDNLDILKTLLIGYNLLDSLGYNYTCRESNPEDIEALSRKLSELQTMIEHGEHYGDVEMIEEVKHLLSSLEELYLKIPLCN